ncbi:MAG: alpha-N-acetylglucosaminidase N-terminal domain-containing protein, partial [Flavobacteriaceae bacterium]|nr:alpha-N-acetylglucosaminidase N-terminal domain-containing protein [Flavobacteriaceae bacterium]
MKRILIICLIASIFSCQTQIKKTAVQKNVSDLAIRILGKEYAENFIFKQIESTSDKDEFELSFIDEKVLIKGNTPIAMASGLNWYLKYYANVHISWEAQQMNLPDVLPVPNKPVIKKCLFTYSYYLNYCTFNYTMAFWDWERWEKEIDWMAMNGVNLPLATVGTEAIWKNTLKRLDFTESEINDFIPGPAFNAFGLMGTLEGWGGPLSDAYIQQQVTLQKKILNRMKSLGMKPVVPGFFGIVPKSLKKKYPGANIRDQGLWAGGFHRPAF